MTLGEEHQGGQRNAVLAKSQPHAMWQTVDAGLKYGMAPAVRTRVAASNEHVRSIDGPIERTAFVQSHLEVMDISG